MITKTLKGQLFKSKNRSGFIAIIILTGTLSYGQETCNSNGTGGGDWDSDATWSCTGGANQPSDGNVNTINILTGDVVEINDLAEGAGYFSGAVILNIDGTLTFDNTGFTDFGSLALPGSSVVNVAASGLIEATDFFGTDVVGGITIGGLLDIVWSPIFGVGSGDLTGPGSLDENSSGALPILLAGFYAESMENEIVLSWLTAAEENNDYFIIERSSNGMDFQEMATILGAGTSFETLNYSFVDSNPIQGISYYRLKQTDYDGTSETFKVIAAEYYGDSQPIKISQNFGSQNELTIYNNLDEENTAFIYDMTGRGGAIGHLQRGENQINLNDINVQGGMYIMKVVNALGRTLTSQKFIVQ